MAWDLDEPDPKEEKMLQHLKFEWEELLHHLVNTFLHAKSKQEATYSFS